MADSIKYSGPEGKGRPHVGVLVGRQRKSDGVKTQPMLFLKKAQHSEQISYFVQKTICGVYFKLN